MLLVLSAVAPVGLVYAWVAFNEGNRSVALWLIGGCIFLVFCCVYLFNKAHSVLERFPFQMSSVEAAEDRKNVVEGKSVSGRVDIVGRRLIKKNKKIQKKL